MDRTRRPRLAGSGSRRWLWSRRIKWPASDVDLLLLLPGQPDKALAGQVEQLVGLFWDIGLEPGHSVRTIEECLDEAAGDPTVQTALVEARFLIGNHSLFTELVGEFKNILIRRRFSTPNASNRTNAIYVSMNPPYSLEPNCKGKPRRVA